VLTRSISFEAALYCHEPGGPDDFSAVRSPWVSACRGKSSGRPKAAGGFVKNCFSGRLATARPVVWQGGTPMVEPPMAFGHPDHFPKAPFRMVCRMRKMIGATRLALCALQSQWISRHFRRIGTKSRSVKERKRGECGGWRFSLDSTFQRRSIRFGLVEPRQFHRTLELHLLHWPSTPDPCLVISDRSSDNSILTQRVRIPNVTQRYSPQLLV